jgi:hypothetical protein
MAKVTISKLPSTGVHYQPHAPDETNIKDLALTPHGIALLTPKAATLTKADLIALHHNEAVETQRLNLSVADVNSIKQAFSGQGNLSVHALAVANGGTNITVASCCTPCCCAAAVSVEVAVQ